MIKLRSPLTVGALATLIVSAAAQAQVSPPRTAGQTRGPEWARIRTAVTAILGWKIAAPLNAFGQATFFEALEKQDPLFVRNVEGFSTQQVSSAIPKNLDYNLTAEDLTAVQNKLRQANQRLVAYNVPAIDANEAAARKLFEFAKNLNVETIIAGLSTESLPVADKLANEFGINVAIVDRDPRNLRQALEGRSKRVGACAAIGGWMEAGIKPADGVAILKDRLLAVHLRDRSALGSNARNVPLGRGVAGIQELIDAIYRAGEVPPVISVEAIGPDSLEELSKSYDVLEKALQLVVADRVAQLGRTTPARGPDRMRADRERIIANIQAAAPAMAQVKPRKPRKLLVMDLNVAYPGHGSIPAANIAIDVWGKKTGAYEAVFSNDLDNLKYPKIREFDGLFLNNTVGQIFPDPQVRESLMRFVREGGGLGGYHGAPHASIDWTEFGDMLAARAGSHRSPTEKVTVKIDDPKSPITAAFDGAGFEFQDEFYRFTTPPYSRDKVHVLLSFDTEKTDLHQLPNCEICVRPDNDYPIAWIRSFGKGRIFYATIGHNSTPFETPPIAKFFLAGIQFILGDLDADTTPGKRN
jgi:type 1 glutamine amidotransferase/sugar phosphate isomerase/epimerase